MQYEFKVKDLELKNKKDRETGARLLKEYEKSAEELNKKQEEVKRLLTGEVTKAINDLYIKQKQYEEEEKNVPSRRRKILLLQLKQKQILN